MENIDDKIRRIDVFITEINKKNISNEDKNEYYKSIIDSIIYTRIGQDITIKVNYK